METAQVLFVCLGNICRSPMAEAVMRHLVAEAGLSDSIAVDSAGTGDWHVGRPPHEGTRAELDRHGIGYEGMKARTVRQDDYNAFHYIVCMDNQNLRDARKQLGLVGTGAETAGGARLFTFMELLPERGIADVPDPYYEGNFEFVYELVNEGCRALLRQIVAERG